MHRVLCEIAAMREWNAATRTTAPSVDTGLGRVSPHGDRSTRGIAFPRWRRTGAPHKENVMLWTIALILVVLWLLGLVTSYTIGGFIHILLVLAVIVVLFRLISGRRLTNS